MDDFTIYGSFFVAFLDSLSRVLDQCIKTNLVHNFEKFHFMVHKGIVLGHLVSSRGIEVNKIKIDVIISLPYPASMQEMHFFLDMHVFIGDSSRISTRLHCHSPCFFKRT